MKLSGFLSILAIIAVVGCGGSKSSSSTTINNTTTSVTTQTTGSGVSATTTYTLPTGTVFKEIQTTPDSVGAGITFPRGIDDNGTNDGGSSGISATGTITAPFVIAETLTTYQLWSEVYTWATTHGYTFANPGIIGSANTGSTQQPVTTINWRDAMIWCNALTEYYNANGGTPTLDCVYYTDSTCTTPLRTSTNSITITYTTAGTQDDPYIKASSNGNVDMSYCTAKGFRLPSSNEYEYAARYIGTTLPSNSNYVLSNGVYYYTGNSASGATAAYTDGTATTAVSVYNVSTTAVVTSKTANALGLHDMSGNVYECCFDWCGSSIRVVRGGSFGNSALLMQVGIVYYDYPYYAYYGIGFRFARNK